MDNSTPHEIELYPPELFNALLKHEINKSRRYGGSLTLVHLIVQAEPQTPQTQHAAEVFVINALNIHLRDTDIPSKQGNEFRIMLSATSTPGARTACERLRKLMLLEPQTYDRVSFTLSFYMGLATLPSDHTISSDEFSENASKALEYAQTNRMDHVAVYSEIYK